MMRETILYYSRDFFSGCHFQVWQISATSSGVWSDISANSQPKNSEKIFFTSYHFIGGCPNRLNRIRDDSLRRTYCEVRRLVKKIWSPFLPWNVIQQRVSDFHRPISDSIHMNGVVWINGRLSTHATNIVNYTMNMLAWKRTVFFRPRNIRKSRMSPRHWKSREKCASNA